METDQIELKERYIPEIRKEVIAFANTNGGTVYIGIRDDGTVSGLDDAAKTEMQVNNVCRDSIAPDITLFIRTEILTVEDKSIVAVHVSRGTRRPYYLTDKGMKPSGVYVRQGSSSAPASEERIRQMIKESDGDRYEKMRSVVQELTFVQLREVFESKQLRLNETDMRTLGLVDGDGIYSNLALLLSDQCPHVIKAASFNGTGPGMFQDRREFAGSLLVQLRDAYDYLDMRNALKATFSGLYRKDKRSYPEEALREALVNSIVHREYSLSAPTLISIFSDRTEIISYGGLTGGITLEDALAGLSICRNPELAAVFYRLELIEAYGTGLRKIRDSYAQDAVRPGFFITPNTLKVVLPNRNTAYPQSDQSAVREPEKPYDTGNENIDGRVMALIKDNGSVTRRDIEEKLEVSLSTAGRILRRLSENGRITAVGSGKNTKYIIC